jgi:putative ABC transport system ATP-binding protein
MLEIQGLEKRFGERVLFADLDLVIAPGAHTLIEGESGVGKTTLLNLIARLDSPTSGSCSFGGTPYSRLGNPAAFRLRELGILFQELHLIPSLSVLQNLDLVMRSSGRKGEPMALLEALGIASLGHQRVVHLSRGECQRVALARAFANGPKLILADEPTNSLDAVHREQCLDQLFSLCAKTGATALVVSHDSAVAARGEFAQRIRLAPPE